MFPEQKTSQYFHFPSTNTSLQIFNQGAADFFSPRLAANRDVLPSGRKIYCPAAAAGCFHSCA